MTPVVQSRVGLDGTCFRACLASILDLKESQVPDFGEEGWIEEANEFLAKHGLKYRRVPVTLAKPDGYSTIEGVSPRGGLHACVAKDGELVWDPHPVELNDGQGLVEPRYWGLLEPLLGRAKREAERQQDVAPAYDLAADARNTNRSVEVRPVGGNFCKNCGQDLNEHSDERAAVCATKLRAKTSDAARCEKRVRLQGVGFGRTKQCSNNAVEGRNFCAVHDPDKPAKQLDPARERLKTLRYAAGLRKSSNDRADMLQLRRNTERQGGPFFMQVTEKDGKTRVVPVSKMGATDVAPVGDASKTSVVALLLALVALYRANRDKRPETYDITKYQPPKRYL